MQLYLALSRTSIDCRHSLGSSAINFHSVALDQALTWGASVGFKFLRVLVRQSCKIPDLRRRCWFFELLCAAGKLLVNCYSDPCPVGQWHEQLWNKSCPSRLEDRLIQIPDETINTWPSPSSSRPTSVFRLPSSIPTCYLPPVEHRTPNIEHLSLFTLHSSLFTPYLPFLN
jgi:hypothetical protein